MDKPIHSHGPKEVKPSRELVEDIDLSIGASKDIFGDL